MADRFLGLVLNGRELANSPRSASTFPLDRLSRSLSDLLNILTKLEQVGGLQKLD